jgi:choline-sulfatase
MTEVTPPNLLVIMADQLAAQWLPAYGHPAAQTPALDALAEDGVVFESAYCASPLCAPSRAAMLTGQLPSHTEVYDNAAELRASVPTIAHRLRAAGYDTSLAGKMHFVGPDQLHGFEERLTTDIYPADLDWTPDWGLRPGERLPWYHTMESVLRPGVCEASMQMDYDEEVAFRAARKLRDLARRRPREPFFLVVSFTHPHDPWEVRAPYWDRYDRGAIELPTVGPIPPASADPHSVRLREMCDADRAAPDDEQVRTARHAYFAALSYVDERIGEVLSALRDGGLADDTIVVFTSDHGELLGERGLWYKMAFFEASSRVPLIVHAPGRLAAGRVAEPVSQLDIMPTLLDLAGVAVHDGLDGASLAPLLRGGAPAPRPRDVVSEYFAEGVSAPAVMIRRGDQKYIWCEGDPEQLYDLSEDPDELTNQAANPAYADVRADLHGAVLERWDLAGLKERVLASQRARRLVARGLSRGAHTPWDFQPHVDASRQYVRNRADLYELQRRARLDAT